MPCPLGLYWEGLCPLDCFLWLSCLPLLIIQARFIPVYFPHFHMCLQVCVYTGMHVGCTCVGVRACHPVMFAPGSLRRVSQSSPEFADTAFPGQLLWRSASTSEAGTAGVATPTWYYSIFHTCGTRAVTTPQHPASFCLLTNVSTISGWSSFSPLRFLTPLSFNFVLSPTPQNLGPNPGPSTC